MRIGPGFPVVIRGDVVCEEVDLEGRLVADQLRSWVSAEGFNRARQVDRGLADAADQACLDVDDARAIALHARRELSGGWPVLESTHGADHDEHAGLCFDVRLDRLGVVSVDYARKERPSPPRGSS